VASTTLSYWQRLRGLNRNAKLYLVSTIFRATSFGIWSLLFNLYLLSMGFDEAFIGLANTLYSAFSLICSLPAGLIADRIGRKRAMAVGFVGMTLSRLGVAVFAQGWQIAASSALFGIVGPLFLASIPAFLTENSTPRERAILFTVDWSLMSFFGFVGTTVGGYLPQSFAAALGVGIESTPAYRGAMLTTAAVIALGLLPVLGLKDRKPPSPPPAARLTWRFWQRFSSPRLLAKLLVPRVLLAFGAGLIFPFLNLFYKEQFGLSDAALGWIFGITNVLAALMMLAAGVVAEHWGSIRAILITRVISTPMLLIIGFVPSLPIVAAAHWIRSGLMRLGEPLYMAFAMEQLDESERATGSSLLTMSWDVGWSAAPYVSGLVQVRHGFGPLFVSCMALYGLSLVCAYRFFGGQREASHAA
jgi:MFS family permease